MKKTAMRVRVDAAIASDPADLNSIMETAKKIQMLKEFLADNGFVLTADVSAALDTETKERPEK